MNLIAITALIAVCGAAKLDRTYLPPASAKTAGGSPGSLKTPFSRNSFNNGLGGLPKGSYENDFQGVVVDAAAPGTRTSGESGLGAPRISYGSTNSKVGSAAFKTQPTAFRQPESDGQAAGNVNQGFQAGQVSQESLADRPRASLDRNAGILRFENDVGPENYHFAYETDNGIQAEENGVATNGVQAEGGFSYTGDDGQVYSVSYTADERGYQPKGDHLPTPPPIPVEILKSLEQNARDEAAGLVDDGSYDAQKYNAEIDYTKSENANGKFPSSNFVGAEADATPSGTFINQDNQPFKRPGQSGFNGQAGQGSLNAQNNQNSGFGQSGFGATSDSEKSDGEINTQSGKPTSGLSGQFGQANSVSASSNRGSTSFNKFGQSASSSPQAQNSFGTLSNTQSGSSSLGNRFGNRNEYLPPTNRPAQNGRPQNSKPQNGRPQNGKQQVKPQTSLPNSDDSIQVEKDSSNDVDTSPTSVPLGQQDLQSESRPQASVTSFGKPISNGFTSQNAFASSNNQYRPSDGRKPSVKGQNFAQTQSSQFGNNRPNEYLPPVNDNRRPSQSRPQISNNVVSQFGQQYSGSNQDAEDVQTPQSQSQGSFPGLPQSTFASQSQQFNNAQRPQSPRPSQNGNRFQSSQGQAQFTSASAQSASGFGSNSRPTSQPDVVLTTPLEPADDGTFSAQTGSQTSGFATPGSKPSNKRPTQSAFGSQFNNQNGFGLRPQGSNSRPFGQTQASAFPTQSSFGQFNQNSQFENQPQSQNSFFQKENKKSSPSTQKSSITQQPQGADDSYYYNQPAKPFGTPQASRFPSAPSNQFTMNQQSSFSQSGQFFNADQEIPSTAFPSGQLQSANKQPRPPTLAPPTDGNSQVQSQFSGQFPGSTRQPRPPTLAPTAPTSSSQTQFQGSTVSGVTQASISPFPSETPTQANQYNNQGQFGSRPSFGQSSQFSQSQTSQPTAASFGQQSTQQSFGQQIRPQRPIGFQSQSQTFEQQSTNEDQKENVEPEQPVASPQYTGEIYEYNKPAQTLPPPDSTPASSGPTEQKIESQGQITGQPSRPQFGQTSDKEDQRPTSQFNSQISQTAQGSRPQFGSQARPQLGQNPQTQNKFGAQSGDTKPYGALAMNSFNTQTSSQLLGSRPQFGGPSRPQFGQALGAQTSQESDDKPQFGAQRPQNKFEQSADSEPQTQPEGSQNQFGFNSPCCMESQFGSKPQAAQSQFAQNSFSSVQGFQPAPTSSFSGQGEQFDDSRSPPSFDENGYHY